MPHRPLRLLLAGLLTMGGLAVTAATAPPAAALAVPTITVTSSPNPSEVGEIVTIVATVAGTAGTPTGTVTFTSNGTPLGVSVISSGTATLGTTFITSGDKLIQAEYSGNSTYDPVNSVPFTQTVDMTIDRRTWTATAAGNWSTAANWSPAGAPEDGDTLVFEGPTSGNAVNDIADLSLANIAFTNGATISGLAVEVTGSIHALEPSTIDLPVSLPSATHAVDGDLTLKQVVSGAGAIEKTGPGELTLQGANTYTGATDVEHGTLSAENNGALGGSSAPTTVASGASIVFDGVTGNVAEPISLTGPGSPTVGDVLKIATGSTPTFTNVITLSGAAVEWMNLGTATFNAAVNGSSTALTVLGTSATATVFGAANTFNGLDVTIGSVTGSAANSLGTGPVTLGQSVTATLTGPVVGTRVFSNAITTSLNSKIVMTGAGSVGLTGAITLGGNTTIDVQGDILNIGGVVSGAGQLTKQGAGSLFFSGTQANTSTGLVTVSQGDAWGLKSGGKASVPGGVTVANGAMFAATNDEQLGGTVTVAAGGTLDFFGADDTVDALTSAGEVYLGLLDDSGNDFTVLQTGALTLSNGGSLYLSADVFGHDVIKAATSVSLGGALNLSGDFKRATTVKIIDNLGAGAVTGTFAGLPEGAAVFTDNTQAFISYKGGDGNDVTITTPAARSGYWMVDGDGRVYAFGDAKWLGAPFGHLNFAGKAVDIEPTPDYNGYWVLTSAGNVFPYGNAVQLGQPLMQMGAGELATSISGDGFGNYWVFTNKGRVFDYGDAGHFKDMAGRALNGPVLGSVGTPSGFGYFMVASDGGIFAFGDAVFRGSMGGTRLNGPVVGLAPDPDNDGYWLVATDGGIFAFNATFKGSMGGKHLNKPMIGMVAYGDGYLMVASDGGIFNFSNKPFKGSLGGQAIPGAIVSVAPLNEL